ncbi:hypothetical protein [Enterococcus sp.]|uniref:hypothetical protein n=1 Tax=Enterococcus sp. TaxID=35783 RepID=UPI0028B1E353|nr:hypothetical protein [Enterococcus sp.]
MSIRKFRYKNKYLAASMILLTVSMLISWFFASNFFEILTMDYTAPDLDQSIPKSTIQKSFLESILTWENFVDSSMYHIIDFLPVLVVLPMLGFFDEFQLYHAYGRSRIQHFFKYQVQTISIYSVISACALCLALTCLYSIAGFFVVRSIDDIGGYASILPANFYQSSPFLFFLFMIWTIYFVSFFVLNFLAGTFVIFCHRKWQVLILTMFICFGSGILSNIASFPALNYYGTYLAFNTELTTLQAFTPIFIFMMLACVILFILRRREVK